jgi:hypothetical protein
MGDPKPYGEWEALCEIAQDTVSLDARAGTLGNAPLALHHTLRAIQQQQDQTTPNKAAVQNHVARQ